MRPVPVRRTAPLLPLRSARRARGRALALCAAIAASGCADMGGGAAGGSSLLQELLGMASAGAASDEATIAQGLREALRVGTERAVARVARPGGFADDPRLHIPLPKEIAGVASTLRRVGLGGPLDELETAMNRAAETASAEARAVFWDAARAMTIEDAFAILRGGDDAATRYFREHTEPRLRARFEPIVAQSMQQVGVYRPWRELTQRVQQIPLLSLPQLDLEGYVSDRALDGLFAVLAQEEARIRADPAARTTALLRRVFGAS